MQLLTVWTVCCFVGVSANFYPMRINNVCRTIPDYAKRLPGNKNCWYDPDVYLTPDQIIQRHGYPVEKYEVTTEDGYILGLFRIPNNGTINKKKPPIILQHGLAINSIVWLLIGKKSLGFLLADNGYDVWLPNFRGGRFSSKHKIYNQMDPDYWNFSFHELGIYDLPAVINFVKRKTKNEKVIYIGHSMGTTASYIFASLMPEKAKNDLHTIISLAPVAYANNMKSAARFVSPFWRQLSQIFYTLGIYGFGPSPMQLIINKLCSNYPTIIFCVVLFSIFTGFELKEALPELLPIVSRNYPEGASVKTLIHYAQLIEAPKFSLFDYGKDINLQIYHSITPPEYNISNINVPVHLFYGKKDFLADFQDVNLLYKKLNTTKTINSVFEDRNIIFSHNDFIGGKHLGELNKMLLSLIKSYT